MNSVTDPRPVAIVAHDAGGAEVLSSYLRRRSLNAVYALAGPAVGIFARKLGPLPNLSIEEAIGSASSALCGTSLPSSFELQALAAARRRGLPTTAILEHWVNFRERFVRDGSTILPDTIWTLDDEAHRLALDAVPECTIEQIENPYKLDCLEQIGAFADVAPVQRNPEQITSILYVTEPTSFHAERMYGDANHWGYTERTALEYFLARQPSLFPGLKRLILRPHPSETREKYLDLVLPTGVDAVLGNDTPLLEDIAGVQCVVGCNSMAMVVADWAQRLTICAIPPGGLGYSLRAPSIRMLREIPAHRSLAGHA